MAAGKEVVVQIQAHRHMGSVVVVVVNGYRLQLHLVQRKKRSSGRQANTKIDPTPSQRSHEMCLQTERLEPAVSRMHSGVFAGVIALIIPLSQLQAYRYLLLK